jgi:hypothetical protein
VQSAEFETGISAGEIGDGVVGCVKVDGLDFVD